MIRIMRSAIPVIVAGLILWAIALIVSILASATAKVILTCVFAITLGLIGISYTKRRGKRAGN